MPCMETPGQIESLRLFLFCPDLQLLEQSSQAFDRHPGASVIRSFNRWPEEEEAARLFKIYAPNVVALDVSHPEITVRFAEMVRRVIPGTQIIAIHRSCEPETLLQVMRLGIQEFLSPPFKAELIAECF